ncbi:MAG: HEAT repeat domain-containing protein [Gemmataceae bacterium]
MHTRTSTSMVMVPGDRFVSGSRDATLKNWPRGGAIKPSTLKDECGKIVSVAVVTVYNQPHLAAACEDNTIRLFKLDAEGKFPENPAYAKIHGANAWIKNELAQQYDAKRREKALKTLAEWKDAASIDIIGEQITKDQDPALRLAATKYLTEIDNPRVVKILERSISHGDSKVRVMAFNGLFRPLKPDLGLIDFAFKSGQPDVGVLAVKALELPRQEGRSGTDAAHGCAQRSDLGRTRALASPKPLPMMRNRRKPASGLLSKHGDISRPCFDAHDGTRPA